MLTRELMLVPKKSNVITMILGETETTDDVEQQ
jgi:hypothetical protein